MNAYGVRSKSASYLNYLDVTCGAAGGCSGFPSRAHSVVRAAGRAHGERPHLIPSLLSIGQLVPMGVRVRFLASDPSDESPFCHGGTLRGGGEQATISKGYFPAVRCAGIEEDRSHNTSWRGVG